MKNFIEKKLKALIAAGAAVPLVLMLCAATFGEEDVLQQPRQVHIYADSTHRGAVPLENAEGWQVRLRAL